MTKIEELHYIIELLNKHDLPMSPILEYAIKEREEQYTTEANGLFMRRNFQIFLLVCLREENCLIRLFF